MGCWCVCRWLGGRGPMTGFVALGLNPILRLNCMLLVFRCWCVTWWHKPCWLVEPWFTGAHHRVNALGRRAKLRWQWRVSRTYDAVFLKFYPLCLNLIIKSRPHSWLFGPFVCWLNSLWWYVLVSCCVARAAFGCSKRLDSIRTWNLVAVDPVFPGSFCLVCCDCWTDYSTVHRPRWVAGPWRPCVAFAAAPFDGPFGVRLKY